MKISEKGRELIKDYEKLRLFTYLPTPEDVPTIGWGHTGKDVSAGRQITIAQAEDLLTHDCLTVETCLNTAVDIPLTQNQFDALGSLVFNVGVGGFLRSNLRIAINTHDIERIRNNWLDWDHQGGKVLEGLKTRREKEYALFMAA